MPNRWKWPATIAAGMTAAALTGIAVFAWQVPADSYREKLVAEAHGAGAQLQLAAPLQWQVWPPGLQAPALTLHAATENALLLEASGARISIDLPALLTGTVRAREILLLAPRIHVQQQADGRHHWEAVLTHLQAQPATPTALRLLDGALVFAHANGTPIETDIARLTLSAPATDGGRKLDAVFSTSVQNATGDNLLLEQTLQANLHGRAGKTGLEWRGVRLQTAMAGTLFPGTLNLLSTGDLHWQDARVHSPKWQSEGDYKHIGMTESVRLKMSGGLDIDLAQQTLTLPEWMLEAAPSFRAGGRATLNWRNTPAIVWQDGTLAVSAVTLSGLALQATFSNSTLTVTQFDATPGSGNFSMPFTLAREDGAPVLNASLRISNAPLASFAAALGGSNKTTGQLNANGALRIAGLTMEQWRESASGQLQLDMQNAVLADRDINAGLVERLRGYQSFLPTLADIGSAPGDVDIRHLHIDNTAESGVVTSKARIDTGHAIVTGGGQFNLKEQALSYDGRLALGKSLFADAKAGLDLPIQCRGNLIEVRLTFLEALSADCNIEDEARRELMARALKARFLGP
ncbi:MAG: AsmA-like C-terminal region-containing protein [Moraxellaceae bacterium]|nr:AsmA-like C-terminal region-containing protein [Moraxellaceae bacterium]